MHSYQNYQNGKVSFETFYAQFDRPELRKKILETFPLSFLRKSSYPFTDLPLASWDKLIAGSELATKIRKELKAAGGTPALSTYACIAKISAKRLLEEL